LAAMRQMFEGELARIRDEAARAAEAQGQAADAGNRAAQLAALAQIDTALDTGAGFAEALERMAALDSALPIGPLLPFTDGVEPLLALQRDFPDAARAAIDADLAAAEGGGLTGFLKSQLGIRSLAPKDGDDADAVLSRAEAKLQGGDLAGATAETDALS